MRFGFRQKSGIETKAMETLQSATIRALDHSWIQPSGARFTASRSNEQQSIGGGKYGLRQLIYQGETTDYESNATLPPSPPMSALGTRHPNRTEQSSQTTPFPPWESSI